MVRVVFFLMGLIIGMNAKDKFHVHEDIEVFFGMWVVLVTVWFISAIFMKFRKIIIKRK